MTFLILLRRNLRLFEMDVLVVKCLREEEVADERCEVNITVTALFKVKHKSVPVIRGTVKAL